MISVRFLGTQDTSRNKQHDDNVNAATLVGHFKFILSDCLVVEQIILHYTFRKLELTQTIASLLGVNPEEESTSRD